jgi:acyl carrier protein
MDMGGTALPAMTRAQILDEIVYPAYREVAAAHAPDELADRPLGPDLRLFGRDGGLDSLKLVAMVVIVEERIEAQLGKRLVLANERAMSQSASPFRTFGALADYVIELLAEP